MKVLIAMPSAGVMATVGRAALRVDRSMGPRVAIGGCGGSEERLVAVELCRFGADPGCFERSEGRG